VVVSRCGGGAILIELILLGSLSAPARGLGDGRIGVLYISDPVRAYGFDFMRSEPIFSLTLVAASLRDFGGWGIDDVHRAIRLYLPRNYDSLLGGYDVIVLDNANRNALTPTQIELLARGVSEGGRGLLMTGGWESFGGTGSSQPPWGDSAVGQLLPTEDVEKAWVESGRLVIREEDHEFIASIPWDRHGPFMVSWPHNLVGVKPGAKLLAYTDRNVFPTVGDHPLFITWELPGGARTFAVTGEIALMAIHLSYKGVNYVPWDYYGDFSSNLMIYLARRPVPQDVDLVHVVRSRAFRARTRVSLMMAMIEFIEKFNANTRELLAGIDEVEDEIAQGRAEYVELQFEGLLARYAGIDEMLESLDQRAVKAKNAALLWVHLVEWLAVACTTMLVGVILWSLMVRHRLYREVKVTRSIE
jgi:uncharacterized membrane protein